MGLADDDETTIARETPVKETNIEVCVRIRPLLMEDRKAAASEAATPPKSSGRRTALKKLGSRLTTPRQRKPPVPTQGSSGKSAQQSPSQQGQGSNGSTNGADGQDPILAWDVAENNSTVQQSPLTERIQGRTIAYTLDRVYGPTSKTSTLYETSVKPVVLSAMEGYHASVFAYGQTSTGKTFTMTGKQGSPGVVPLAVKDCFEYIKQLPEDHREFLIRVSYLEIYNEQLIDLLNESKTSSIRILEGKEGVVIRGLKEEVVTSPLEVFKLLQKGEMRRQVGATNMNKHSSRSHAIVRLWMESISGDGVAKVSSLNLVDLAGSESVRLTGSTGDRKREGQYINKSLMTLGQVVYKLSEKQKSHIPYRNSKLTRFLQPSLSGNAQIVVVCNISPQTNHLEESHNTLKFAVRAKKIKQRAALNRVQDNNTLLQTYREEIADLRAQLAEAKTSQATNEPSSEELLELADSIRKMEGLILKSRKHKPPKQQQLQQQEQGQEQTKQDIPTIKEGASTDDNDDAALLTEPNTDLLTAEADGPATTKKDGTTTATTAGGTTVSADTNEDVMLEMHRIRSLLGSVMAKTTNGDTPKKPVVINRDAEVEELKAQLHQQQVATSLRQADSSFLQKQLQEKDQLLEEVSKVLEAVEKRQVQLDKDNESMRDRLLKSENEVSILRRELSIVTGERDRLLTTRGSGTGR